MSPEKLLVDPSLYKKRQLLNMYVASLLEIGMSDLLVSLHSTSPGALYSHTSTSRS